MEKFDLIFHKATIGRVLKKSDMAAKIVKQVRAAHNPALEVALHMFSHGTGEQAGIFRRHGGGKHEGSLHEILRETLILFRTALTAMDGCKDSRDSTASACTSSMVRRNRASLTTSLGINSPSRRQWCPNMTRRTSIIWMKLVFSTSWL